MAPIKILIINPNTNQSMTDSLREPIESLNYNNTAYTYHTSPPSAGGLPSINNLHDASLSATHILPSILPLIPTHSAFLVACYSPHPLVGMLKRRTDKPVVGIFEASVWVGGMLVGGGVGRGEGEGKEGERERKGEEEGKKMGKGKEEEERQVFGIVSTGDVWKGILEDAIRGDILLGKGREGLFGGVETCGLDAGELHGHGEVEGRVKEAVGRLVRRDGGGKKGKVGVVVLGCAGMVGMEGWVREVVGEGVKVVDGVKAGVGVLQGLVRGGF